MADHLDPQTLRALMRYDPNTGSLRWNRRGHLQGHQCNRDREAGSISKQTGYRTVRVDHRLYQAHRVIWALVHGKWPDDHVDHINGDKLDNRFANLRSVPNAINRQNTRKARADSQTGVQGVGLDKRRGLFHARLRTDGRTRHLGYFANSDEAHAAYVAAKRRHHVGCTI